MRVLIQWAKANPQGWEEYEISRIQDWRALPSKPMPQTPAVAVDNSPGWINAMYVAGLLFTKADRYSIQASTGGGIQVFSMFDHPVDNPPGQRYGHVWTIRPPFINDEGKPDVQHSVQWYSEPGSAVAANLDQAGESYLPWSQYPTPAGNAQRFGKWLTYEQFDAHMALIRPLPHFKEWVE